MALQKCFYDYHDDDFANLLTALKTGLLSVDGKKMTDGQINKLRHSKLWKSRYGSYLRKIILQAEIVTQNLTAWVNLYQNAQDNDGPYVFSTKTVAVVEEQKTKVRYASDPPDFEMYCLKFICAILW